jgi:septal ring factor EnvC (AmiA/AmiB activator)
MRCLRTADQFVHTGLERADEAHQEAHVLLEKWEKFALKLDQRRKLLSIVVSFYKQTEEASERLSQIEREIRLENEKIRHLRETREESEEKIRVVDKKKHQQQRTASSSSASEIQVNIERSEKNSSPTNEFTQRHVVLSNQLAEVSAPGLREGRLVLERISQDDFEAKHVIRKV